MIKTKMFFLFMLVPIFGYCQVFTSNLDSVNNIISKLKAKPNSYENDTLIIYNLIDKVDEEINLNGSSKGIEVAEEAIKLSQKINWKKGIANSMFRKAEALQVKSQYFSAINECLKVLNFIDKNEFPTIHAKCLNQIAGCYLWMERPLESKKYFDLFFKENLKYIPINVYNNSLTEFGALHVRFLNKPKESLVYFEKAKNGYLVQKDTFGLAYNQSYLAFAYEKLGQRKLAEQSFDYSIKIYKKLNVQYLLPDALNYASEYYFRKSEVTRAKNLAEEALLIANNLKILFSQRDANFNLYRSNKALGNYKEALFHHELYANTRDSMAEANIDDRLKVINYDTDTKLQKAEIDKKTQENERKNTLIIALIAGLLAFSIISFLVNRYLNIRKKNAENEVIQLQQEKQLIATNSVIKGQEEERGRLAKDLHDGLGGILSGVKLTLNSMTGNQVLSEQNSYVFHKAIGQLDTAISELRRVAHSMMPEALLKFGLADAIQDYCEGINESGKLKVNFEAWGLEGRQEQSVEVNLYRIVQELLNNTIKHAQATFAHVQLVQIENMITLTVEDNGIGFDVNNLKNNKGAGIVNVESRVAYLNGKLDIKSDSSHGTSVEVQVIAP
jgi:signal transduction histidine kinase